MIENIEDIENFKGEKLTGFETEDLNQIKKFILNFQSLNKTTETHGIVILAHNITVVKQDNELENVFTSVNIEEVIGRRLLEYEDWHTENLTDTGNLTAPQYSITLIFEEGYSIEILNYESPDLMED